MNYYEILKVSKNANQEQIKNAYKLLVKKYHPDLYVGDKEFAEKKLREINEAYKILSDFDTKKEYDKYLENKYQENITLNTQKSNVECNNNFNQNIQKQKWNLSDFIIKKINQLNNKQQLKILILVLIIISILVIYNLIEVKQYFDKTENNNKQTQNKEVENYNELQNEYTNFIDIDNMIYELFKY